MAYFKYFFYMCLLIAPTQASPAIAVINESKVDLSATTVNIAPGQTGQITCTPSGSPLPTVQWRKYQGELGKGTTKHGNTLIISGALTTDSGHYVCVGVVDRKIVDTKYAYVEVKGEDRPKNIKLSQQQLTIKAGQNGSIDCIPEGTPVPQVQWRKAEGRLSDRATPVGNTLIITNAQAGDAGDYVCYAIVESTPVFNNYARILVEDVPTTTPPQQLIQAGSSRVSVSENQIKVPRGGSYSVECKPEGTPLPHARWTKAEGRFGEGTGQSGNALVINNAQDGDRGVYVCTAIVAGTAGRTAYLQVEIVDVTTATPPQPQTQAGSPRVRVSENQITVPRGGSYSVECKPEGTPTPQVRWTKAGGWFSEGTRPNGNFLVITNAQDSDRGDYVCTAIVAGTAGKTAYLRVEIVGEESTIYRPDQLPKRLDVSVDEGQDKIISCDFETGDDEQVVTWSRLDQRPLPPNAQQSGRRLIFQRATQDDAAEYLCKVTGGGYLLRQLYLRLVVVRLAVRPSQAVQPRVVVNPETSRVARGSTLVVECSVVAGDDVRVAWERVGGAFSSRAENRGEQLVFRSIEVEDGGSYRCVARNHAGETAQTTQIVVLDVTTTTPPQSQTQVGSPRVRVSESQIKVPRGGSYSVECKPEGTPLPRVQWTKAGGWFGAGTRTNGNVLEITDAEDSDRGDYVCTAIVTGTAGPTAYLRVEIEDVPAVQPTQPQIQAGRPRVKVDEPQIKIPRGGSYSVECKPEGTPLPRVQWTKAGGWFGEGTRQNVNALEITDAQDSDGGDYVCTAIVAGTAGPTAYLRVEIEGVATAPPPQPQTQAGSPRVTVDEPQIKVPRGGSYSVECKPEGTPLPRVQWTKAGGWFGEGTRQNVNALEITDAQDNDGGDYVCTAIVAGTAGPTAYLRVEIEGVATTPPPQPQTQAGSPRVTVDEPQIKVPRGGSYSVECKPEGTPLPRVQWTKAGGWFGAGTRTNGNVLEITDAEDSDRGDYVCTAIVAGTAGPTAYLRVEIEDVPAVQPTQPQIQAGRPRVTVDENQIKIPRGGSYSVECKPEGTPLPRVQWTKAGGWFGEGTRQNVNALEITDAQDSDGGDYVCTAIVAGTAGPTAYLRVEIEGVATAPPPQPQTQVGSPRVTVDEPQIKVPRGGSYSVECKPEGTPLPRVQWTKAGGWFGEGTRQNVNALEITDAQDSDGGDYVCTAIVAGTAGPTAYLRVEIEGVATAPPPQPQTQVGSPRVTVDEPQIKVPRGGSYSVECKPEGTPLPRVQWTKAEGSFGEGTGQSGNALVINNAQESDRGIYVCTAIVAGTAGRTAYLQVEIEESEPAVQYAVSSGVRVSESQLEIAKGESKTVECYPEGEPLPSVQWSKQSGAFASGTKQEGNALVITRAEEGDRGNYICSAVVDGNVVTTDYLTVEVVENNETDKSICSLPKETSWCIGERWYYDPAEHKCISFSWAGCPGNANNFESEEACNLVCSGV